MSVPHCPGMITVDEYYEMARVGLIDPEARVELIERSFSPTFRC